MEPMQREETARKSFKDFGHQYLCALIKSAEWIPEQYKVLLEPNKFYTDILKELYLCACDAVPIDLAISALDGPNPREALSATRKQKLVKEQIEKEAPEMEDHGMPSLEPMPMPEPITEGSTRHSQDTPHPEETHLPPEEPRMDETQQDQNPERKPQGKRNHIPGILATGKCQKKRISHFISGLIDAGYGKDQVDYILSCIEEGMEIKEIKQFASPKLPVDVMKRIKKMKERNPYGQ